MVILERRPLWFRLAKFLARKRIRGSYRLWQIAEARGWDRYWARYRLREPMQILVPIYREENRWDQEDIDAYEQSLIHDLSLEVEKIGKDAVLLDCGAEIGIFSMKVLAACPRIKRVVAFEPNPEAYEVLAENFAIAPVPAAAHHKGVSDREGRGTLLLPDYDDLDYARYVEMKEDGDFEVTTIDALGIREAPLIVLKADVEGAEEQVLYGARETLRTAKEFIAVIEAHPAVVNRTKRDPNLMLRWLQEQRPCHFWVAEAPSVKIDPAQPFFSLFPNQVSTLNIIISTQPR